MNAKFYRKNYWRQQMEFREVHQQDLTKMKELQKFQNSTFDALTRQKFIEDQNTIMELFGRLQELQNQVNCMNDSKDIQDAESIRSGIPRYTSTSVFPTSSNTRSVVEAFIRVAVPQRRAAMHLGYTWYIGKRSGPSAKDSIIFSGGDSQRIVGQTNNDCRFRIFILTSSQRQQPLFAGR